VPSGTALVIGESLVDVRHDTRVDPPEVVEHPGGSPLNIAVALARLGVETTLATRIGDDDRGAALARHVADSGVELVRLAPTRPTSTATAVIGADGAATYEFELAWSPDRLPDPADYAVVHVGSIGAVLAPGADLVAELAAAAATAGVPVAFDPNVRPAITPDLDDVRRRAERISDGATMLKLSDEDAALLYPALYQSLEVEDLPRRLVERHGVRLVVVTGGAAGLVLDDGAHTVSVPAQQVTVADTIGAGDTVTAALLAGLLERRLLEPGGWPTPGPTAEATLEWLGSFAVQAAAATCARPGADPPWRAELAISPTEPSTDR